MMKGSGTGILALVLMLVSSVVGFAILDTMSVNMMHPIGAAEESETFVNATTFTLSQKPVFDDSDTLKGNATCASSKMVRDTNYTISNSAGTVTLIADRYDNNTCGNTVYINYAYEPTEYLGSSLSRTIMTYVVPVGILGLLAIAAMAAL